ncbi:hypothetical protein [Nocardia blacklockiae]|uniref:hypothetical protein n=1 Tax=Nocardia blacklockiae TaxID=480036 RepID=UPI0018932FE7|nr:hypothetical protein [Nocardia blacklockiae]MBF6175746.1 hypothetical protein [Nocardia blacklockiae]
MPLWPGMIAPEPPRRRPFPAGRHALLAGSVAVIVTTVVVGEVLLNRVEARAPVAPPEVTAGSADLGLGGGAGCAPIRTAELVRGDGAGSTASGPDVVLAFQYAYYVTRSGAAARQLTAPDAWVSPAAVIDVGIATVPVGTRHCVEIVPQPENTFFVTVTELRLDRSTRIYRQVVTVATVADATLITRIDPVRVPR